MDRWRNRKYLNALLVRKSLNYAYLQETYREDSSSFCYNDLPDHCEKYGRLYLWSAAMDSAGLFSSNGLGCGYGAKACSPIEPVRGVCPSGWHLPSLDEWNVLRGAVGHNLFSHGTMLKSSSGWNEPGNGTDDYGFMALPAGMRNYGGGSCFEMSFRTYFWSSTQDRELFANVLKLVSKHGGSYIFDEDDYESRGFSVRCVKD